MPRLIQFAFDFDKDVTKTTDAPNLLKTIQCFECNTRAELDGYRFRLVPLCHDCRTKREVEITRNRFERRQKR